MNTDSTLGYAVTTNVVEVDLTEQLKTRLDTLIDTITASKLSLLYYIYKYPELAYSSYDKYLCQECTSICYANDTFSIGLPINSIRFTLRSLLRYYSNTICTQFASRYNRQQALENFIHSYPEVLLVYPEIRSTESKVGTKIIVGEFSFTVKSTITGTPTFIEFVKTDLKYAELFYTDNDNVVRELSEFRK